MYENALIIAPRELHGYFYDYRKEYPSADFILMSLEEAEASFRYSYDEDAALYLIKNKGFTLNYSLDALKAISCMEEGKTYKGRVLEKLYPIFIELLQVGLLRKPIHPEIPFKERKIINVGYPFTDRIQALLNKTGGNNLSSSIDHLKKNKEDYPPVYSFPNLYMEVHYLANAIADLIANGTSPDSIYIGNYSEEYRLTLELISKAYGFTIDFPSDQNLRYSVQAKTFFDTFASPNPLNKGGVEGTKVALDTLLDTYPDDSTAFKIAQIIDKYADDELSNDKQREVFESALEKEYVPLPKLNGAVGILNSRFAPIDSHVFLIDFSLANSPKVYKDNLFLSDEERKQVGLPTSLERNKQEEVELKELLKSPFLEAVTHKDSFISGDYFPSPLMGKGEESDGSLLRVIKSPVYPKEYCRDFAKICAASMRYEEVRFGNHDERYPIYKEETGFDENAKGYDYSFTGVDNPSIRNNDLTLSYSSVDHFNKCPFSYYAEKILLKAKLEEYSFPLIYGDIFHRLINADYLAPDFSFNERFNEAYKWAITKMRPLTSEENFFLPNVKMTFEKAVNAIKEYEKDLGAIIKTEQHPLGDIKLDDGIYLTGFIDKAIFTQVEGKTYLTIVDYKTGGYSLDIELIDEGFALQLPVYTLLAEKMKESGQFNYDQILGIFISQTYPHSTSDRKGGIEKATQKSVKLKGYYLNDLQTLQSISPKLTEGTSYFSQQIWTKKNGYKPTKMALFAEAINELPLKTETQIKLAASKIKDGQFAVEPHEVKGKVPCEYCQFWEVCHRPGYLKIKKAGEIDDEEDEDEEKEDDE